jgi:hypothetical protein
MHRFNLCLNNCGMNFSVANIITNLHVFCFSPRIPPANRSDKGDQTEPIKPVYVGEFPQVVRDEQASLLQKHSTG